MVLKPRKRSVKDIERTFKRKARAHQKFLKYKRLEQEGDDEIEYWENERSAIFTSKVIR